MVGYVHPFDTYPDPAKEKLTDELPVDVALDKVDYIEVLGFSDHKSTARVWYRLLNCGFHLPTAAGTDAMANFASLRGPVGLNRVYVEVPEGKLDIDPCRRAAADRPARRPAALPALRSAVSSCPDRCRSDA